MSYACVCSGFAETPFHIVEVIGLELGSVYERLGSKVTAPQLQKKFRSAGSFKHVAFRAGAVPAVRSSLTRNEATGHLVSKNHPHQNITS